MKLSKKNPNTSKTSLVTRVIAIVLVALMLISAAYYIIASIIIAVSAGEIKLSDYEIHGDTKNNIYVACGIHFNDDPELCCTPSSNNGFLIGEAYVDRNTRTFTPLIIAESSKKLLVSILTHLTQSNGLYVPCDPKNATILPYHVEITSKNNSADVWDEQENIDKILAKENIYSIKAIAQNKHSLRYGQFTDAASASEYAGEVVALLGDKYPDIEVNISIPTGTCLCYIDAESGTILFEYDNAGDLSHASALYPIDAPDGSQAGTTLASGRTYFDAVLFIPDGDMINTTNLVKLDTYVQGVLPSEIYSSWPLEVQKAFAIIVRSYSISSLGGKHFNSYNADMCATACCQAYKGREGVNSKVTEAVNSTSNLIMAVEGKLVSAYYSAVNGGESISNTYAWGGTAKSYLPTQKTPWEKYTTYIKNRGVWFAEFTPQELCDQLRSKNYTDIKKPIASVTVDERAGDTGYVYKTTYTDTAGNSVTITRTSKNYSALSLRSANFNIAKDSVDYFIDNVLSINVERRADSSQNPLTSLFNVITANGIFNINSQNSNVITGNGIFNLGSGNNFALTENGISKLPQSEFETTEPDENGYYTAVNVYDDTAITTLLRREHLTYTATQKGSFVIAGKGWGHGIGLSQYGANDLAEVGAQYDQIIKAYYSNTDIITISDYFSS